MERFKGVLYSSLNYAINLFYCKKEKRNVKQLLKQIKEFKIKNKITKLTNKITRILPSRFHKVYNSKRWYITEEEYSTFLTGLYYLGYEKYSERAKGQEKGTDQFLEFYDKLVFFIGNYYKYTQSKKLHYDDNEMQIAQVQFIKFLDQGKSCVIKGSKSYIYVLNYTKDTAKVVTKAKNFKHAFLKCATKNKNIISSMLLFNEGEDEGHANTLIISYEKGCVWRVEPNIYYYWTPFFYDNLDRALATYFNENKDIGLEYKGLYPYTLKSTPDHVGLCVMISALQLYLPQNMTHFNVKYYLLKFFEWEYHNIFHKKFDLFKGSNQNLMNLIKFIRNKYKRTHFQINGKDYLYKQVKNIEFEIKIDKIVVKGETAKKSIILDSKNTTKYLVDIPKNEKNVFEFI